MMNKLITVAFIALIVAASGCTSSDLATEEDVNNVAHEVEKADSPSYRFELKDIRIDANCEVNESVEEQVHFINGNASITDWQAENLQQFNNGKWFVRNGFTSEEAEIFVECGNHFVEGFMLESVKFQKTTYKDGAEIDSREKTCNRFQHFDTRDRRIYESGTWELSELHQESDVISDLKSEIYEGCLGIQ